MQRTDSNAIESARSSPLPQRELTDKLRVFLHGKPLFDLKRSEGSRAEESRHYDTLVLVIRIWDLIVDNMGLDTEVDRPAVARELYPLLGAMDEAHDVVQDRDRHDLVVGQVIGALCNEGDRRRPFEVFYQDYDGDGRIVTRKYPFQLIFDYLHPSGATVLRLSPQALNLYLRSWDLDVEDEQAAAEAVVLSQLNRKRFDEAAQSASKARIISLQYWEKVSRIIRDTKRDVGRVDWLKQVPELLSGAFAHIKSRLDMEHGILKTARERLDVLEDAESAKAVAKVIQLVKDCRLRHCDLHSELMQARDIFLAEQERQQLHLSHRRVMPALVDEVVEPLLSASVRESTKVLDASAHRLVGSIPPSLLSLSSLIPWLLRPHRPTGADELPVEEPDLVHYSDERLRFPDDVRQQGDDLLSDLDEPTRLSELLEVVGQWDFDSADLEEYLVLSVQHDYATDHETEPIVDVEIVPDGELDTEHFYGDELLISPRSHNDE
ncbi:MAG: hypothetical protein MPJ50_17205 [Pirellulales bacterium]|nr:hypothetical protein [Pirellulales bacterium]